MISFISDLENSCCNFLASSLIFFVLDLSKFFSFSDALRALSSLSLDMHVLNSAIAILKGREMVLKVFESGIFLKPEESKKGTGLKVPTRKQMLQRLPIALA